MLSSFSDRVKRIIEESGCNKARFADRINISPAYLSQICSGVRTPSDRTISDICREFNVNEHWLRTGEGEMQVELPERERLAAFFGDVLASAPDERSALISALAQLPKEGWPILTELAREFVRNLPKDEE